MSFRVLSNTNQSAILSLQYQERPAAMDFALQEEKSEVVS